MSGLSVGPSPSPFANMPGLPGGPTPGPWAEGYVMPYQQGGGEGQPFNWGAAGLIMSAMGAVNSLIGGYFSAQSQRYQLKSQAKTLQFQSAMSEMNARMAETEATSLEMLGQKQASRHAMAYGVAKSAARASLAARGIDASVGSAAESIATMEFAKQTDMATINANAVRAAEAQRIQALNYRTQSMMQAVSAENIWATRKTISPAYETFGNLLSTGGTLAMQYGDYKNPQMRRRS